MLKFWQTWCEREIIFWVTFFMHFSRTSPQHYWRSCIRTSRGIINFKLHSKLQDLQWTHSGQKQLLISIHYEFKKAVHFSVKLANFAVNLDIFDFIFAIMKRPTKNHIDFSKMVHVVLSADAYLTVRQTQNWLYRFRFAIGKWLHMSK